MLIDNVLFSLASECLRNPTKCLTAGLAEGPSKQRLEYTLLS